MSEKIRTTIRPDVEVEVSDAELAELRAQGLVLDTKATTDEGAVRAASRQQSEKE